MANRNYARLLPAAPPQRNSSPEASNSGLVRKRTRDPRSVVSVACNNCRRKKIKVCPAKSTEHSQNWPLTGNLNSATAIDLRVLRARETLLSASTGMTKSEPLEKVRPLTRPSIFSPPFPRVNFIKFSKLYGARPDQRRLPRCYGAASTSTRNHPASPLPLRLWSSHPSPSNWGLRIPSRIPF